MGMNDWRALARVGLAPERLGWNFTRNRHLVCQKPAMANDQSGPLVGLAEVVFLGGPHHARRIVMAHPEFQMELEQGSGERVTYRRQMVESEMRGGCYVNIATYAPVGITEEEFSRLVIDAARLR